MLVMAAASCAASGGMSGLDVVGADRHEMSSTRCDTALGPKGLHDAAMQQQVGSIHHLCPTSHYNCVYPTNNQRVCTTSVVVLNKSNNQLQVKQAKLAVKTPNLQDQQCWPNIWEPGATQPSNLPPRLHYGKDSCKSAGFYHRTHVSCLLFNTFGKISRMRSSHQQPAGQANAICRQVCHLLFPSYPGSKSLLPDDQRARQNANPHLQLCEGPHAACTAPLPIFTMHMTPQTYTHLWQHVPACIAAHVLRTFS